MSERLRDGVSAERETGGNAPPAQPGLVKEAEDVFDLAHGYPLSSHLNLPFLSRKAQSRPVLAESGWISSVAVRGVGYEGSALLW